MTLQSVSLVPYEALQLRPVQTAELCRIVCKVTIAVPALFVCHVTPAVHRMSASKSLSFKVQPFAF